MKLKAAIRSLLLSFLGRVNFTRTCRVNGTKVRIPIIGGVGCSIRSLSEPWMTRLLEHLLPIKPGAFLDVGVNLGQTLVKVKSLNPNAQYIGIEPNSTCIAYLYRLIAANRFQNCTVVPIGLFDRDGILPMDFFADNMADSAASMIKDFRPSAPVRRTQYVPVFRFETLQPILNVTESYGIIKIDVEGAELEVLQCLRATILRDRPIVLVEILPAYSSENQARVQRQNQIERLVAELHYSIFRVKKDRNESMIGLQRLSSFGIHSDLTRCDYVLLPEELESAIATFTPVEAAI